MSVLGLIPCRGGSKGIPRKNLKSVAGEPLLSHTIRASREADGIDATVVSTDDAEIRDVAADAGARVPFSRPNELATDEAPIEPVVEHALRWMDENEGETYETVALLQATSPLRTADHIEQALETFQEKPADSLVAVSEESSYRWEKTPTGAEIVNYDSRTRRQEKSPKYVESGAIYLVDTESFLRTENLQAGRTTLCVIDRIAALDIDEPFELWMADKILTEWRR